MQRIEVFEEDDIDRRGVCVCVSSSRVTSFSFRSFRKEIKKENFSRESYFESYPIIIHIVFYGVCSTHHDTNEVVKLSET